MVDELCKRWFFLRWPIAWAAKCIENTRPNRGRRSARQKTWLEDCLPKWIHYENIILTFKVFYKWRQEIYDSASPSLFWRLTIDLKSKGCDVIFGRLLLWFSFCTVYSKYLKFLKFEANLNWEGLSGKSLSCEIIISSFAFWWC